jgi:O-antigen ligase
MVVLAGTAVLVPVAFVPWLPDVFCQPKLALLWAALATAVWLLALDGRGRSARVGMIRPLAVDAVLLVYLGLEAGALVASSDHQQSLFGEPLQHQGALSLLLYAAFYSVARLAVRTPEQLLVLVTCVVGGAALVAAYGMLQRSGHDPVWDGFLPDGRVFSTIGQSNALGAYLAMTIPLALAVGSILRGLARIAAVGVLVVNAVALAATLSRGAYLAAASALAVVALLVLRRRTTSRSGVAVAVAVAAAVSVVAVAPVAALDAPRDRVRSVTAGTADLSIRNHLDQWRVAVAISADAPLLGTGQETFPDQFPRYSRRVLHHERVQWFDQFRVESPHNAVLTVAAGSGWPAAVGYVAFLLLTLGALCRCARRARDARLRLVMAGVAAAVAAAAVSGMFMTAEVTSSWMLWTLAGAATGIAARARRADQTPQARDRQRSPSRRTADCHA